MDPLCDRLRPAFCHRRAAHVLICKWTENEFQTCAGLLGTKEEKGAVFDVVGDLSSY